MITPKESTEEARESLKERISSLKKQTIFSLALAFVCVIITLLLFYQLNQSNQSLAYTQDTLKIARDSLDKLSKKWRKPLVDLNRKNDSLTDLTDLLIHKNQRSKELKRSIASFDSGSYITPIRQTASTSINQDRKFDGYLVYIQDRNSSTMSPIFKQLLQQRGFTIPRIEHIDSAKPFGNAVKYFHKEDKDVAMSIQKLLLDALKQHNFPATDQELRVFYLSNNKVPFGQLEVWIDK